MCLIWKKLKSYSRRRFKIIDKDNILQSKKIISGIYYIRNTLNNKLYIGSSKNISNRIKHHSWQLNSNRHHNKHLQKSWNKYGEDNFEFGIIEIVDNIEELFDAEQAWMDYFESYNDKKGYNISAYAECPCGYPVSDETREKLRQWHLGRKISEETRRKYSEIRRGEDNHFYGKHHTKEAREKIRQWHLGRKMSPELAKKVASNLPHNKWSQEYIELFRSQKQGEKSPTSKLKEKDVINILKMIKDGKEYSDIRKIYDVSNTEISRIRHRKRWAHLYEQYPELYT